MIGWYSPAQNPTFLYSGEKACLRWREIPTFAPSSIPDCTRLQIRSFDAGEMTGPRSVPG